MITIYYQQILQINLFFYLQLNIQIHWSGLMLLIENQIPLIQVINIFIFSFNSKIRLKLHTQFKCLIAHFKKPIFLKIGQQRYKISINKKIQEILPFINFSKEMIIIQPFLMMVILVFLLFQKSIFHQTQQAWYAKQNNFKKIRIDMIQFNFQIYLILSYIQINRIAIYKFQFQMICLNKQFKELI
ncbi:transmembrane protein, putative (macronuclear) [Tetrahymena thermophila SB210]|uniref:Transmembrane protein, putative n=1 Tax=Tetrahymena thermophila (strain SB210) TaxID=312017 RepID=W7XGL6_TETTS|nr:transmembrane protein, putative [Tetrahymena thermophila SB210]EWS76173.1 transmembrane protein, putative [Tetrahymena thermophila SB210]|eukprot:XP_012651297.1 transmembrane protein, putative [Tetrahymena thermophila SB210]